MNSFAANLQSKVLVLWLLCSPTIVLHAQTGPNPPGHDHKIESITDTNHPKIDPEPALE